MLSTSELLVIRQQSRPERGVDTPVFDNKRALFFHSSLSNIIGSTLSARRAGIQVATNPSITIARTTPANTAGSRGVARYTMSDSTRLASIPSINPAAEPKASNLKAGPNAAFNICLRCAPSATRSPSSRSRLLIRICRQTKNTCDCQDRTHPAQYSQRN